MDHRDEDGGQETRRITKTVLTRRGFPDVPSERVKEAYKWVTVESGRFRDFRFGWGRISCETYRGRERHKKKNRVGRYTVSYTKYRNITEKEGNLTFE